MPITPKTGALFHAYSQVNSCFGSPILVEGSNCRDVSIIGALPRESRKIRESAQGTPTAPQFLNNLLKSRKSMVKADRVAHNP
jgi:hypothetical protein